MDMNIVFTIIAIVSIIGFTLWFVKRKKHEIHLSIQPEIQPEIQEPLPEKTKFEILMEALKDEDEEEDRFDKYDSPDIIVTRHTVKPVQPPKKKKRKK
jgi:LPXTG-motif cell wall-anchored protein